MDTQSHGDIDDDEDELRLGGGLAATRPLHGERLRVATVDGGEHVVRLETGTLVE